ncbi:MAG: hypothetical protein ACXWH7_11045, partial [Thermoanaerobaculia bacterium]
KAPLRTLANDLADEVAARVQRDCDRIRDLWSEGRKRAAFSELRVLVTQPSWLCSARSLQGAKSGDRVTTDEAQDHAFTPCGSAEASSS